MKPAFNYLIEQSSKTFQRGSRGNKFSEDLKDYSSLLYLQGGPHLYEMISNNASVPSLASVKKLVLSSGERLTAGSLNFDGLFKHMQKYQTNRIIISEDATRLISKVTFDATTNNFLGLIGPED